jgi:hypothetical protein
VFGTAALMAFAVGRLLVGSSDASDAGGPDPAALQAAATVSPSVTSSGPAVLLPKGTKKPRKSKPPKPTPTPLAQPSGPCAPDDVVIAPEVRDPIAGSDIVVALSLHSVVSPACTFDVSSESVTMNITSGHDPIWSSRDCPRAVPTTNVVVRRDVATYFYVTWNAKRSDSTCSRLTDWALPGWYHVRVAALGGEPADEQFQLSAPQPAVLTTTVTPEPPKHTKKPKGR